MSGPFVVRGGILSKLRSSNVSLVRVVLVKCDSKVLWLPSYQGVGSVSLPVDSGQVVTALTDGIRQKG